MKKQADMLAGDWRVLLVMDAARADYTRQLAPEFGVVEALGGITHMWCEHLWKLIPGVMTYFSANPVVTWKRDKLNAVLVQVVEVWRECWEVFTPGGHKVGSVHPDKVNQFVLEWIKNYRAPRRMVVHYLQPHAPYIRYALPVQVGNLSDGPKGKRGDVGVESSVKAGLLTWRQVREAYMDNLRLVLASAKELAGKLEHYGQVIITSDHGEALGEKGRYGHAKLPFDLIRRVPIWRS